MPTPHVCKPGSVLRACVIGIVERFAFRASSPHSHFGGISWVKAFPPLDLTIGIGVVECDSFVVRNTVCDTPEICVLLHAYHLPATKALRLILSLLLLSFSISSLAALLFSI